ncbi:polyprenyl synthetase family protein [Serpentinicella sp. ANB-PHB4]|uniref:polyprenyl synthetase family protein n=1 Tax=Serpentinicella sp. ANB-PHB4 TaxID=3074076 RepID=UPI0028586BF5|nr:farnesyl diphosphate synthase [Serpentinicella sp. ANB-PHB4]MDR5658187.1 polyprenyl synthetase family protein [Serpentinicella sp. ANB-PHB4]
MNFKEKNQDYISLTNKHLNQYFDFKKSDNKKLIEAMKYSLFAGGKRIRPIIVLGTYNVFGTNNEEVLPYACALEMIHTYSLIHDDLPAMDNDDFRRGKPTNHKVYGEGLAVLAGDGLLNYAFEIMLANAINKENSMSHIKAMYEISKAAGINGMIGGQIVDLESENKEINASTLEYIHMNKTAALLTACFKVGAIIGQGTEKDIQNMSLVGKNLGLAFQIKDDILDVVGDTEKLGKKVGSDEEKKKSTYPVMYGLDFSINKVKELTESIHDVLQGYGEKANFLLSLSQYLIDREY